jgi:hypothetical protein
VIRKLHWKVFDILERHHKAEGFAIYGSEALSQVIPFVYWKIVQFTYSFLLKSLHTFQTFCDVGTFSLFLLFSGTGRDVALR